MAGKHASKSQVLASTKFRLTCMMRRMSVLFWKSYSRLKWIWPTFSLGSELSMYISTKEMDLLCRNAFCNTHRSPMRPLLSLAFCFVRSDLSRDSSQNTFCWERCVQFKREKERKFVLKCNLLKIVLQERDLKWEELTVVKFHICLQHARIHRHHDATCAILI